MMFPESLRWRIQIWYGFLLAAALVGFGVATYRHQAANELKRLDGELRQRIRVLAQGLPGPRGPAAGPPPPPGTVRQFSLPAARAAMFDPADGGGFYYVVWRRDGTVWSQSSSAPADIEKPALPRGSEGAQTERTRGNFREAFTFTPPGECMLVGRSMAAEQAELRDYARWLAAISAGVFAAGLAVGAWIAKRAFRPVAVITSTAARIARGEWSERIPVREKNSELGRLSTALNDTFSQLEESFARQSRFTADAAHELRTPVAIILSQAQRILTKERDVTTYQQTLETCVKAARRLQQLTESLLELATHDAGALELNAAPCDLAEIARESVALIQPIADERNIALHLELAPAPCSADAIRIGQIVLNLASNALDHTIEGSITILTQMEGSTACITVSDTGSGISPEHLPHIFERFYRADDSRDRKTGGAGLGLAICKAIADAHGADLEAKSDVGKGSSFTLKIRSPGKRNNERANPG